MNVTGTGVAVALAVVVALGFLFFGSSVLTPAELISSSTASMPTDPSLSAGAAGALPTVLTVHDEVVGTGAAAAAGDTITVNYVGAFPDGTVFDASQNHGQPFTFTLGAGSVIAGWDQGLVGMKEGGARILVIPPDMAYGAGGSGPIPPNATLLFRVELVSVEKGQ